MRNRYCSEKKIGKGSSFPPFSPLYILFIPLGEFWREMYIAFEPYLTFFSSFLRVVFRKLAHGKPQWHEGGGNGPTFSFFGGGLGMFVREKWSWRYYTALTLLAAIHCWFLLLWIGIISTWKWLKMMPMHKNKNQQCGPEGLNQWKMK